MVNVTTLLTRPVNDMIDLSISDQIRSNVSIADHLQPIDQIGSAWITHPARRTLCVPAIALRCCGVFAGVEGSALLGSVGPAGIRPECRCGATVMASRYRTPVAPHSTQVLSLSMGSRTDPSTEQDFGIVPENHMVERFH